MRRNRPGITAIHVMMFVAMLAAIGAITVTRVGIGTDAHLRTERRAQAMWLARSLVSAGKVTKPDVQLDGHPAHLSLATTADGSNRKLIAKVQSAHVGEATVEAVLSPAGKTISWSETWNAPTP